MSLKLIIGNKNYSSWSFRPWIAMKTAGIPFDETVISLYVEGSEAKIRAYSPAGKVPILIDGDIRVWESLAIIEYVADKFPGANLWPALIPPRSDGSVSMSDDTQIVGAVSNLPSLALPPLGGLLLLLFGYIALIGPINYVQVLRGSGVLIKAFAAAVVGGFGSLPGAILGGLLVGVVESLGAGFISGTYKDVYAFILLIVVLLLKPSGILGVEAKMKA